MVINITDESHSRFQTIFRGWTSIENVLRPILTVTTVRNTGETGDMHVRDSHMKLLPFYLNLVKLQPRK